MESKIFTPCQIGPVTLRNRLIRSAAFENMAYGNRPSQDLFNYHLAVARGGVGMTTVAYASVNRSGLSFDGQLWMREEIVPELKKLTDAIHAEGAKASIQLGHCGNMTHRATCGCTPVGASRGFNLYSPTFVRKLRKEEIYGLVKDFGHAVNLAREAGFDCVEIHAGHGYLISQFLSPYTNHRHDEFGGSLDNRMRFMRLVIEEVMRQAKDDLGVVVKVNMHDGFRRGMQQEECLKVAQELERLGVHALVLTAGFVSKAPMEVMRGAMPLKTMAYYMDTKKFLVAQGGSGIVRSPDGAHGALQRGLFPRRRQGVPGQPEVAFDLRRRFGLQGKDGGGARRRIYGLADGARLGARHRVCEQTPTRRAHSQRLQAFQLLHRQDVHLGDEVPSLRGKPA